MKKIKQVLYLCAFLFLFAGCDKDFVEINTDPFAIYDVDLGLIFAGAQRTYLGDWEAEHTIVQQFVNPFNDGATLGFNFNEDIDNFQNGSFNQYLDAGIPVLPGAVKAFVHILKRLEGTTDKVNLQSITRIWKAFVFMDIVDHYGNVPYFEAGKAAEGEAYFYPAYDDDEVIYNDLYTEITEALANLDPSGDYVSADLFYGAKAYYPTSGAADQVAKWQKLGNSILLRLGMRYSKFNPTKAASIVSEAFTGGVMTSNTDNAFVVYDGTLYTNTSNNNLINNNPRFYYAAEPFVDFLKSTLDPRSKYIVAAFDEPNNPLADLTPDSTLANQFGVPVGVLASSLASVPYRGIKGGGYNYSQMNVNVVASIKAPTFWVTYAQTSLLLAEAAHRGWIAGGEAAAQQYYEDGIRANMDNYALYLTRTGSSLPAISVPQQDTYLAQPAIAYNATDALALINTQYWVVCIRNGAEAWANFRRSGYPTLTRNTFDDQLLENGGDGYVHRFSYPDAEISRNNLNYLAAVTAMGGIDNITARIFWDIP
jgi:hypothetical protein